MAQLFGLLLLLECFWKSKFSEKQQTYVHLKRAKTRYHCSRVIEFYGHIDFCLNNFYWMNISTLRCQLLLILYFVLRYKSLEKNHTLKATWTAYIHIYKLIWLTDANLVLMFCATHITYNHTNNNNDGHRKNAIDKAK